MAIEKPRLLGILKKLFKSSLRRYEQEALANAIISVKASEAFLAEDISDASQLGKNLLKAGDIESALTTIGFSENRRYSEAYQASTTISALKVVALNDNNKLVHASSDNLDIAHKVIGMLENAVIADEFTKVINFGFLFNNAWDWTLNKAIFLGINGQLTQNAPISGFIKQIAIPLTHNSIQIQIESAILL